MSLHRPCLTCGEPSPGPRCPDHTVDSKSSATERGYDAAWKQLSKRARRLQPFCLDCGAVEDLQTDHLPAAWERKAAGKAIRLRDVEVVCGPCNRDRGTSRPRGEEVSRPARPPVGKAQGPSHTPGGYA